MLITRPHYDDTTFYCSEWAKKVIEAADKKDIKIIDLKKERVNRKNVEGVLTDKKPKLVLFNGHGDDETVLGHNNETLIKLGLNENLLESKIIHALSCSSARMLGKESVKNYATTYIGYENDFFFFWNSNKLSRPFSDDIARPFFESSNQVPISIINGKTTGDAFLISQKSYEYWIAYYRLHGEVVEAPQILLALMWNKASQVIHGDREAKFE